MLFRSKVFVVVVWWSLQCASAAAGENTDHTPVGASRPRKAMLLRHILLKKAGQTGFMMRCSIRIRSSVNKVLGGGEEKHRKREGETERGGGGEREMERQREEEAERGRDRER